MEDLDLAQSPRKRLKLGADVKSAGAVTKPPNSNQVEMSVTTGLVETALHKITVLDVDMAAPKLDQRNEAPINAADDSRNKELEVGIKELVNPGLPGFTGILKKRYTDFLVNEILPSGEVVHLDNIKAPRVPKKPESSAQIEKPVSAAGAPVNNVQSGPVVQTSPQEPLQDNGASLRSETPAQVVGKEDPQTATGVQEASSNGLETTAESKNGDSPEEVSSKLKTNVLQEGFKEASKDESRETSKSTPSKNAFPESDRPLNQWQAFAKDQPAFQLSTENSEILHSYFEAEAVTQLLALFNRVVDSPHRKVKDYGIVNAGKIADRQKRKKIHEDLRKIFSSRLESVTDENGAMIVTAAVPTGSMDSRNDRGARGQGRGGDRGRGRGERRGHDRGFKGEQQRPRLTWQELGGDHLHFTIYKENKDTMEVIGYLNSRLHLKSHAFQFAGTKDRRAVTVQRASVYRVRAEQLASVGRWSNRARIGNFRYQKQGLDLGDLLGNEFVITLRNCQFAGLIDNDIEQQLQLAQKIVQNAAKHFSEEGFINYYGLQRFGTFVTRTDTVGLKMLQGDYKGAIAAILEFTPEALAAAKDPMSANATISSDDQARAWAIDKFQQTGKNKLALDELPRKFTAESSIIRHLGNSKNRTDFQGALQFIPRNLRLMYVHAYQSLVWNLAASERWARFGKDVVEGDLVLVDDHKDKEDVDGAVEAEEEVDSEGGVIVRPAAHDSSRSEEERFERARALTAEEAKSGRYTIFDIVLPTPGFDVLYPANEVGEFYTTYMKSEAGGNLDPKNMRRAWKDISLSGNYRKLVAKPLKAIEIEVKSYVKEDEQFIETDMERLEKKRAFRKAQSAGTVTTGQDGKAVVIEADSSDDSDPSPTKPQERSYQRLQPATDETIPDVDAEKAMPGNVEEKAPEMTAAPLTTIDKPSDNEVAYPESNPEQDGISETRKVAVILKLQLGSSQYATMALRELMKEGGVRVHKPDFGTER